MLETLGMNAAGAAFDNTIGLIAGGLQANRQMKNQRKLMAEQLAFDKLKMEEQRKMQMQMWEDTNFAAQVEQLKKAGLSIGLMYGKGGAGGTTTGAGATGVSAPTPSYRDWETDRKSTRLNSSHITRARMPSSA